MIDGRPYVILGDNLSMHFILGGVGRLRPQLPKVSLDNYSLLPGLKASSLSTVSIKTHVVLTSSVIM